MRTTIAIDDDVLAAAKSLAVQQHKSIVSVISALARRSLRPAASSSGKRRNGIPLLPMRRDAVPVTPELVKQLRDEMP
jgi:hypothetical protein